MRMISLTSPSGTATIAVQRVEPFSQLRIQAVLDAAGDGDLLEVQWFSDADGLWQLGTPGAPGTTGVIDLAVLDGRLIGTIGGTMSSGEATRPFSATLDLSPEYWTFPPERFCPGGGGG